jgi:hypothetical protein
MGKPSDGLDHQALMRRYGDGTHPSVRQIAREFATNETKVRRIMADYAAHGVPWSRNYLLTRCKVIADRLEQSAHELAALRAEIEARFGAE